MYVTVYEILLRKFIVILFAELVGFCLYFCTLKWIFNLYGFPQIPLFSSQRDIVSFNNSNFSMGCFWFSLMILIINPKKYFQEFLFLNIGRFALSIWNFIQDMLEWLFYYYVYKYYVIDWLLSTLRYSFTMGFFFCLFCLYCLNDRRSPWKTHFEIKST